MALSRRTLLKGALLAVALFALRPIWRAVGRVFPARWVKAVKGKTYPGRVVRLDENKVQQTSKWSG